MISSTIPSIDSYNCYLCSLLICKYQKVYETISLARFNSFCPQSLWRLVYCSFTSLMLSLGPTVYSCAPDYFIGIVKCIIMNYRTQDYQLQLFLPVVLGKLFDMNHILCWLLLKVEVADVISIYLHFGLTLFDIESVWLGITIPFSYSF